MLQSVELKQDAKRKLVQLAAWPQLQRRGPAAADAAAAVSVLIGSDIDTLECAAEIALEHHLGLTCDPILGYVQIPCIERNGVAAMRAINAAELAELIGEKRKVSFDMVVDTMFQTGKDIKESYRETAEAGLAAYYKNIQIQKRFIKITEEKNNNSD